MVKAEDIKKFLKELTDKIKPVEKELQLASWDANISGKKEDYDKYEAINVKIEEMFNNKQDFEKIEIFLKEEIKDKLIKRELEVWYRTYLGSQGDLSLIKELVKRSIEIEKEFNTFRGKIDNKEVTDNDIKEILKTETNSEKLKVAWEAGKEIGSAVEKKLIELIKLRNKYAKSLGFANYYSMSLELTEIKENELKSIFDELAKLTEKPFKKLKNEIDLYLSNRYKINAKELKPWHYHDRFFQEGPEIYKINLDGFYSMDILEIAKKFYSSIDMPIEDILNRSDLYEKPGKYQHACCFDIDREGDVRTIMNIKNDEKWMSTILHELGHANYDKFIDKNLPFILRYPAHMFTTEAIAMFFGRLSRNTSFIRKYCNIENKDLNKLSEDLIKALRLTQLVFFKWADVIVNFEREMYKNPEQNLNKLWWQLVKKYQLIDFSRDKPDWASKIHLASAPVYYQNYVLGELLASQINNYIAKNIIKTSSLNNLDYSDSKEIVNYLKKKIFSAGRKYKWDDMIKKATREKLTPKYFVEQFVNEK